MISRVLHVENEAWNILKQSREREEKECNLLRHKEMLTGNIVLVPVTSVRTHN